MDFPHDDFGLVDANGSKISVQLKATDTLKINYSYEIPLLTIITLRGAFGDHHKHHESNGLYLQPVLQALAMPYTIIDKPEDIGEIGRAYRHSRTFARPTVVALTRGLLK